MKVKKSSVKPVNGAQVNASNVLKVPPGHKAFIVPENGPLPPELMVLVEAETVRRIAQTSNMRQAVQECITPAQVVERCLKLLRTYHGNTQTGMIARLIFELRDERATEARHLTDSAAEITATAHRSQQQLRDLEKVIGDNGTLLNQLADG